MDKVQYDSSDSEPDIKPTKKIKTMEVAPSVPDMVKKPSFYTTATTKEIARNMPLIDMNKPMQGPKNPYTVERQGSRNMMSGYVEEHHMNDDTFKNLHRTFNSLGYTLDPDAKNDNDIVGDLDSARKHKGIMELIRGARVTDIKKKVLERVKGGDVASADFLGPWASFKGEEDTIEPVFEPYPETIPSGLDKSKFGEDDKPVQTAESSIFHGAETKDYLGRSFLHPPSDLGFDLRGGGKAIENFIPKQLVHTWTGHTKGVNCIRFFPKTAHLILSASMDCKVKIWDVYHQRQVKRTYIGHSKGFDQLIIGVKDVGFFNDGTQFLSASYDKYIKLWDTETGDCISRYTTKKIPFCVAINPNPAEQNSFLVGCQDKKIYQFDKRSGEIIHEYAQHSGAINSITFIDDNKRFVSTSDDKSLRCWEFNVPIVIKYVSEPDMHSMPSVTLSDNQKWLACQSLDNKIVIFSALDRLRLHRKKLFSGHLVAGYICKPGFSPDNRFVMSGDSEGKMWFWDWKTCKVFKKFKAHDGPILSCLWHPKESSKVATCSQDGTVKYWD